MYVFMYVKDNMACKVTIPKIIYYYYFSSSYYYYYYWC